MTTYAYRFAALGFLGCLGAPAWAGTVYNSLNPAQQGISAVSITDPDETDSRVELPGLPNREVLSQVGDSITLAGTDRFVTAFTVRLGSLTSLPTAKPVADVELSVFTDSGGLPGSLLWNGTVAGVVFPDDFRGVDVTFVPRITVPTSLVFSIAFSNISNPGGYYMGIATDRLVYVGSSGPTVLEQATATGAWTAVDMGDVLGGVFQNLQASVTAVPAPGALVVLGVAAFFGRLGRTPRRHLGEATA